MLPIVDLSFDKEVIKEQIVKGLTTSGFLYLKSHGIGDVIKEAETQMRSFFYLPEDHPAKEESKPETFLPLCGYYPYKYLSAYKTTTGKDGQQDACQQFFALSDDDNNNNNNRYPKSIPEFGPSIDKLFKEMLKIGEFLLTIIGEAMNIDMISIKEGFFSGNTTTVLKLIHYPIPTDEEINTKGLLRMAPHSDVAGISVLYQDPHSKGALQVLLNPNDDPDDPNSWIDVTSVEDSLVVNAGELLKYMTGGRVQSTRHRVRMPTMEEKIFSERFVMALFMTPRNDFIVTPIGEYSKEGEDKGVPFGMWFQRMFEKFKSES